MLQNRCPIEADRERLMRAERSSPLDVLFTCRQIYVVPCTNTLTIHNIFIDPAYLARYSEPIDILYTHNTFEFEFPFDFNIFRLTRLPKRFSRIRSIIFYRSFPNFFYDSMEIAAFI